MTDYVQEQDMEIEALLAILMDDIKEINSNESGLGTSNRCFQILLSPQDDDMEGSTYISVQLALNFSHTEKYPDVPPLLNVMSIRGIKPEDITFLKDKLQQVTNENLGMAMIYTLVTTVKDWLIENFGDSDASGTANGNDTTKEDIIVPHGEPVTVETFLAWREQFEAEMALVRTKLMPESVLMAASKEKKLGGRKWFESGATSVSGLVSVMEGSEEEDGDDIDFDFEDDEDEDDMLDHYLAEKSSLTAGSRQ